MEISRRDALGIGLLLAATAATRETTWFTKKHALNFPAVRFDTESGLYVPQEEIIPLPVAVQATQSGDSNYFYLAEKPLDLSITPIESPVRTLLAKGILRIGEPYNSIPTKEPDLGHLSNTSTRYTYFGLWYELPEIITPSMAQYAGYFVQATDVITPHTS